jgi:hypothetical protein
VHLPGISYAGDIGGGEVGFGKRRANRDAGGAPPVVRLLLSPADMRGSEGNVFFSCRGDDPAPLIYDKRACAAGADVNAEDVNGSLFAEAENR